MHVRSGTDSAHLLGYADSKIKIRLTAVLLGLCGFVIYTPLVRLPFLADDYGHLLSLIRPEAVVAGQRVFALSATQFRPLEFLVLDALYRLFGLNAHDIHISYMVLHAIVIIELFILIYRLSGRYSVAVLASVFFLLYPRNVEAVMWIASAENEVLMSLFLLGACLAWIRFRRFNKPSFRYITLLLFVLALLTKESAGPFPAVVLALDLYLKQSLEFRSRRAVYNIIRESLDSIRALWPIVVAFVLYCLFDVYHLGIAYQAAGHSAYGFVGFPRLAHYVFMYPIMGTLPFIRYTWIQSWKHFLLLSIPVFILFAYCVTSKNQQRVFGVIWFGLWCLPTMLLAPFRVSDLYFYLPVVGLCMVAADFFMTTKNTPWVRAAALPASLALLAVITYTGISQWRSDISIFNQTADRIVNTARSHPRSTITINHLMKSDGPFPLFNNAVPALVELYDPSFEGVIVPHYTVSSETVASITY